MENNIYTFLFNPDWMRLTNEISRIDRFDASWSVIEKREGQTLKQLKSIATVRSVGASTRIEGSKMTDVEVDVLIKDISVSKLDERDQQEVAGYFETLELIADAFGDIEITENNLKSLHNRLMIYSEKDGWHKGEYKQHSNVVERKNADGTKQIIFETTSPGIATEDAMRNLVEWYRSDTKTFSLIKASLFIYEFLSIHPFQDGNGRLSRLLGSLLLLKSGYSWIQYVSFEHEIENRKSEYYRVLMQCQRQRPGEDVSPWVIFFLDCLKNIQEQLTEKLKTQTRAIKMSPREKSIYSFIESHPGSRSGEIAEKLQIPLPSVKRTVSEMVKNKFLDVQGIGAGTNYSIVGISTAKKDAVLRLTNAERKKELVLENNGATIEIKKIVLIPLFKWTHPDEWSNKLLTNGLLFTISCGSISGAVTSQTYSITSFVSTYSYQPVFSLSNPILIPDNLWDKIPHKKDYPMRISIELSGSVEDFEFDVMLVYDEV